MPAEVASTLQCYNCGAIVQPGSSCLACGAPLALTTRGMSSSATLEMTEFIEKNNQNLAQAGSAAAEAAFGLGCSIGAIFSLAVLVVVFVLGSRNWILMGLTAMGLALASAGVAAWLSTRAKEATLAATHQREIEPEIIRYLQARQLNRLEFDSLAHELLSDQAPLRKYLSPPKGLDPTPLEE